MKSVLLAATMAVSPDVAPVVAVRPELSLTTPLLPSVSAPTALTSTLLAPSVVAPSAKDLILPTPVSASKVEFDGRAGKPGAGWKAGAFKGDGGATVVYKERSGGDGPARVYAGGLALNESFEPLYEKVEKPAGHELFLWTRGHPPTGWIPTRDPLDADARDLASAINIAKERSGDGKVELALHSFGTLVFQRMIQLHKEPSVAAALAALKDSRVFMLHATTHYDGSEQEAGPEFAQMGQATRAVVDWLNAGDAMASWMGPASVGWDLLRSQVISNAAAQAAEMMRKDLAAKWEPSIDHIRKAFLKDLAKDSKDPGWQESMLRRSSGMFRLEFSKDDARRIRDLGIKLELVHSDGDALLNWASARALFARLGIKSPKEAPPAGTVLTDESGRFRARIVSGDHYFPLKKPEELAEILK